jgi:hypothetical protein
MRKSMRYSGRQLLSFLVPALLITLLVSHTAMAQAMPPDLVVTLRDAQDKPLAGISVQVRANTNGPLLAQAVTGSSGTAEIAGLTVDRVVVVVSGSLPGGTRLVQPGQDARGIAVLLGPPPTRLDLRVDADGQVLPDPATMIDPIPNGPTVATAAPVAEPSGAMIVPTSSTFVPRATSVLAAATPPLAPPPAPVGAAVAAPTSPAAPGWLGWGIVAIVLTGLVVLVWQLTRQRAP